MLRKSTWSGLLIVIVIFVLPTTLFTQDEPSTRNMYKTMDRLLSMRQYEDAMPLIERLLELEPDNANFNFKMAYAIIRGSSYKNPMPYLEKAITNITDRYRSRSRQTSAPVDALWYIALEHFYNYNYEVAESYFLQYQQHINELHDNYDFSVECLAACKSGPILMKSPVNVHVRDFSDAATLPTYFHSGLFSPDEAVFVFTADRNPEKNNYRLEHEAFNDDIFSVYYKDSMWSEPRPLSVNINSTGREASIGMHPNGKMMLVYREDADGGNLYYSDLIDSSVWSPLKKFPKPINSSANETHATISADGKIMYFTSDRKGGYGGLDIYMSRLSHDSVWLEPVNLGPQVNTEYYEESPHFQANSNLLYWSSNRPGGMGGFDVYRGEIKQDSLASNVRNIGYPINTPHNDMFFKTTITGGTGYYSSSCTSTNGEYNMQIVDFQDASLYPDVLVKGLVIKDYTDTLYNNTIFLSNLTSRTITDSCVLDSVSGLYEFNLHSKNKYFVSVRHNDTMYYSKPFLVSEYFADYTFENEIELRPIFITDSSLRQTMSDFFIIRNSSDVSDDSPVFDSLENVFAQTDSLKITILSRTNTIIDSAQFSLFEQKRQNRNIISETQPEQNELIAANDPIDTIPVDTLTSVSQMVSVPRTQPTPPVLKKPQVKAQVNTSFIADSLLSSGIENLNFKQFDVSEDDLEHAYFLFDSIKDVDKQLVCLDFLAQNNRISGEYNNALEMELRSLSLLEEHKSESDVAQKKEEIGEMYSDLWYSEESIDLYEQSLETYKNMENDEKTAEVYFKIADVLMRDKKYQQAIDYLHTSLDFISSPQQQAQAYNKIAVSYHKLRNYTSAFENYNKAIQLASQINDREGLGLYQNNIANAYFDSGQHAEALIHYSVALGLYQELLNEYGIAMVLYNIGNVNRIEEKYTQAIDNFIKSIQIAEKNSYTNILTQNYFALYSVYKKIGNNNLALEYYKKYYELQSPVSRRNNQIAQFIEKHIVDAEKLDVLKMKMRQKENVYELENIKYQKELELLEERERLLEYTKIGFGVFLGGLLVLFILLLLRFRTRRKYYAELSIKNAEILQQQEEISVQRENLEMLNYQLEQLSIVASQTANAVVILNEDASVEWVNNSFVSLYEKKPENFFNFANSDAEQQYISECIKSSQSVLYETQRTQNGSQVWVQCMLTPIVENGSLSKIILIESDINDLKQQEIEIISQRDEILKQSQDIEKQRDVAMSQRDEIEQQKYSIEESLTELQKTQKQLIESEKMASLGSLVAGISHEINTPVGIGIAASSSLFSQTESLKELFESKKMKQSDLQNYLTSTQEAAQLIQSNLVRTGNLVKSFKQVSVDEMTDNKRVFNLNNYIQEVITSLSADIGEREMDIRIDCPEDIKLDSYPAAYAKIISNMMRNVIRHAYEADEKHTVMITARIIDSELRLDFADKGKGMSPEVVQKVFDPFFTTNMQTGKGLGMSMVFNAVVKQLKGDISCESVEGEGTTYHMSIPIA